MLPLFYTIYSSISQLYKSSTFLSPILPWHPALQRGYLGKGGGEIGAFLGILREFLAQLEAGYFGSVRFGILSSLPNLNYADGMIH